MPKKDEKKAGKSSSGHKMIVCKNCGSSVPADRDVCPYCDAPIKKGASSKKGLIIGSIAGGAAVIILPVESIETLILPYWVQKKIIAQFFLEKN